MRIFLTGGTGLIGSRIEELLFESHDIIPLSTSHGVDITDKQSIESFLEGKGADIMLHLAAKTDVDGCELDKEEDLKLLNIHEGQIKDFDVKSINSDDWKGKKTAVAINTVGTKNLYDIAQARGIKFVYISTDFVFSGNEDSYTEKSPVDPVDWYGMSKYLGEKVVDADNNLIVRISFPYGYKSPVKKDFVWKLLDLLQSRDEVSLLSDQIITPTFIDDIVGGLELLLSMKEKGIYHLTGSQSLTPKEVGEKIKATYSLNTTINDAQLAALYEGKAKRPLKSVLKNEKIAELGFRSKTFDEGLALIHAK